MNQKKHLKQEQFCPECFSSSVNYNADYGYHTCRDCGTTWASDKNDPDYGETGDGECPNCHADEVHVTWSKSQECKVCDICGMEF